MKLVKELYLVLIKNVINGISTTFPEINNERVFIVFIDHLFLNVFNRHFSIKTIKIILKHPRPQYNFIFLRTKVQLQ